MVFLGPRFNSISHCRKCSFKLATSRDLDPFQLAIKRADKPLKWFGSPITQNPNLKVGENEMKELFDVMKKH